MGQLDGAVDNLSVEYGLTCEAVKRYLCIVTTLYAQGVSVKDDANVLTWQALDGGVPKKNFFICMFIISNDDNC